MRSIWGALLVGLAARGDASVGLIDAARAPEEGARRASSVSSVALPGNAPALIPSTTVAVTGSIRGAVDEVDRMRGVLVVEGVSLRAPPEALRGLLPGVLVEARYAVQGEGPWLTSYLVGPRP